MRFLPNLNWAGMWQSIRKLLGMRTPTRTPGPSPVLSRSVSWDSTPATWDHHTSSRWTQATKSPYDGALMKTRRKIARASRKRNRAA